MWTWPSITISALLSAARASLATNWLAPPVAASAAKTALDFRMSRRVGAVALASGVFFILVSFPVEATCAGRDSNSTVGVQALRQERRYRENREERGKAAT